ncbi:MAG TPA: family 10 glycosylhydrolase [Firmicutes bacterium]|nr:family 10 glycosylhydrolase [Bacillota bacterium]
MAQMRKQTFDLLARIAAMIMAVLLCLPALPVRAEEEMRGIWVATVSNIDFPTVKGDAVAQQAELTEMLDAFAAAGLNTVFFQVRPKSDALYRSSLEPWSDVLTGVSGQDPGYDPLAFVIEQAHARGMELHAWINPYRATMANTDTAALAENHVVKAHPDWLISHNGALYLNPSMPEVQDHIVAVVQDILAHYDVDGIHFDDYFYPNGYPLSQGDGDGEEANQRRENVNTLVRKVSEAIQSTSPQTTFGISPSGIYKNTSTIRGSQSYYTVYADTLAWVENGWVDYIAPQVYWESTHPTAAYQDVVQFWADAVAGTDVALYIGEALYKETVASEMADHIAFCRQLPEVSGHIYYNTSAFLENTGGGRDAITAAYGSSASTQPSEPTQTPSLPAKPEEPVVDEQPLRTATAVPSSSRVLVNGVAEDFETYVIDDYTYFKLRDIASAVNYTEKQFETTYDTSASAIRITTGTPYTPVGDELSRSGTTSSKTALENRMTILVDGKETALSSYNIDGYTYYKLRDVAQAVDFGVSWSENTNTIGIVTLVGYAES